MVISAMSVTVFIAVDKITILCTYCVTVQIILDETTILCTYCVTEQIAIDKQHSFVCIVWLCRFPYTNNTTLYVLCDCTDCCRRNKNPLYVLHDCADCCRQRTLFYAYFMWPHRIVIDLTLLCTYCVSVRIAVRIFVLYVVVLLCITLLLKIDN